MGALMLSCVLCFLLDIFLIAGSSPLGENAQSLHVVPYIAKRSDGSSVCKETDVFKWTYTFHDCFIERKYKDGGRYLKSIVDRILDHGEACVETSSRECRPDFQGFMTIMDKTISQMKDYAEMYLEEIYKGRENIKDLECVESILDLKTYKKCFHDIVSQGHNEHEEMFQMAVKKGISCTNRLNSGCSIEAKTAFNRIVRIILGIEQPEVEDFETYIEPTEPVEEKLDTKPTEPVEEKLDTKPTEPIEEKLDTKPTGPVEEKLDMRPTETLEENTETHIESTEPPEEPWMWYDYLAYPFVTVWKTIVGWFSG